MSEQETIRPIRIGVYETVDSAQQAVESLKSAGFTDKEISVLCSEKYQAEKFSEEVSDVETNSEAATAAVAGGALGSGLGGLMALAGLATIAGIPVIAAGFAGCVPSRGCRRRAGGGNDRAGLRQRASGLFRPSRGPMERFSSP